MSGRLVGPIMAGGLREGGENYLNYLKRGWKRKERRGNKRFKKKGERGQACQGLGALKRGGWNPLTNYVTTKRVKCKFISYEILSEKRYLVG